MKKDKRQRMTTSGQAISSPDDFDRRFSAFYKSGVDKIALSDQDKRNLSVKLHQAAADSHPSKQARPLLPRQPLRVWASSAAAIVLVIGGLYLAGLNLGQAEDMSLSGQAPGDGMVGDFGVENDNSSDPEDGIERGGHGLQPSGEMAQDSYDSFFSVGGVNDPHSFYYAVYGEESTTRILLQMSRLILPNPLAFDNGDGYFSSLYLLDLVILEMQDRDTWTRVADSRGKTELKLSAQYDVMAADLYKALGDGYIVVPTPSELILSFDMRLTEGENYRLVLETTDETIYLPFTYRSIN